MLEKELVKFVAMQLGSTTLNYTLNTVKDTVKIPYDLDKRNVNELLNP